MTYETVENTKVNKLNKLVWAQNNSSITNIYKRRFSHNQNLLRWVKVWYCSAVHLAFYSGFILTNLKSEI